MKAIGDVETKRKFTSVANGAITSGDPCVIESAGTVAAVSETSGPATTPTLGSAVSYNGDANSLYTIAVEVGGGRFALAWGQTVSPYNFYVKTGLIDASTESITYSLETNIFYGAGYRYTLAYDPDNSKLAAFYHNGSSCSVRIGTINSSSGYVSLGSAVSYESSYTSQPVATYVGGGKFIVFHNDPENSNYLVGYGVSVSGTTPTVGTKTVIDSTSISLPRAAEYNSTAGRAVVAYRASNSSCHARVVKISSGTTISSGTEITLSFMGSTDMLARGMAEVTGTKKMIFVNVYSSQGTAVVITIDDSDDTVTAGTIANYTSDNPSYADVAYDNDTGAVLVGYSNLTTSSRGEVVTGTISGTTLSFNTPVAVSTGSDDYQTVIYDSTQERAVFAQRESSVGESYVVKTSALTNNLTAENFIGFADAGYADGADASVELSGSITREQSGLTAGQKYYVQNDGSLGTTADDPSVVAGTAISATELIVKG